MTAVETGQMLKLLLMSTHFLNNPSICLFVGLWNYRILRDKYITVDHSFGKRFVAMLVLACSEIIAGLAGGISAPGAEGSRPS